MVLPNSDNSADPVLLTFRKSGINLVVATVCVLMPAIIGVVLTVQGARIGDLGQRTFGMVIALVFGVLAVLFLARQFQPGKLTTSALIVPTGPFGTRIRIPLTDIDEVGMVYTAGAGWLQYVWRSDGTAVRLPLLKLGDYPPDRTTRTQNWQLLASTTQGKICLAIDEAVRRAGRARVLATSGGRHAGRKREMSFWSAEPTFGVFPLTEAGPGDSTTSYPPEPPSPEDTNPAARPAGARASGTPGSARLPLIMIAASSLVMPIVLAGVIAAIGTNSGLDTVPFFGGLIVGLLMLASVPQLGYRLAPLDPHFSPEAAAQASRQQYMAHMFIRMALAEVPALVAAVLTMVLSTSPAVVNYLPGGSLAVILAVWHVFPSRGTIARSITALERDGGRADLSAIQP